MQLSQDENVFRLPDRDVSGCQLGINFVDIIWSCQCCSLVSFARFSDNPTYPFTASLMLPLHFIDTSSSVIILHRTSSYHRSHSFIIMAVLTCQHPLTCARYLVFHLRSHQRSSVFNIMLEYESPTTSPTPFRVLHPCSSYSLHFSSINSSPSSSHLYAFSKALNNSATKSLYVLTSALLLALLITSIVMIGAVESCTLLHGRAAPDPGAFLQADPHGHRNLARVSVAVCPFSAQTRLTTSVTICATVGGRFVSC